MLFLFGVATKLCLRRVAFGDIAANEVVLLICLGPDPGPLQCDLMAIGVDVAALEVPHIPPAPRSAHLIARALKVVRVNEACCAVSDHILGAVSENRKAARTYLNQRTLPV